MNLGNNRFDRISTIACRLYVKIAGLHQGVFSKLGAGQGVICATLEIGHTLVHRSMVRVYQQGARVDGKSRVLFDVIHTNKNMIIMVAKMNISR
jgi:hypothetical protein